MFMGNIFAQERPLNIIGNFTSGYYRSYTRGGIGDQNISFVPAGAVFDLNGYFASPDLASYRIQPELYEGSQAGDAGFHGGNGLQLSVDLLRKRAFPVTFHYSNTKISDAYFGSLSQLSSYEQKNHNKTIGLTWAYRQRGAPTVAIDWGTDTLESQSGIAAIPDYNSHSNHINLDSTYRHWGWDLHGAAGRRQQTSDLFDPLSARTDPAYLKQKITQYEGSARRSFFRDWELYLESGSQSTADLLVNRPMNLTTRYASANVRFMQKRRWKSSMRAAYTSNVAEQLFARLVSGLGSNNSITPDSNALLPFQHSVSYLNLNARTYADLSRGFGLYGSVDRSEVLATSESGLSSRYTTLAAGGTYTRSFSWGSLSGQYGRLFGTGSVLQQDGTIKGQNYMVSAQPGKQGRFHLEFSLRGTDQIIRNKLTIGTHSIAPNASVEIDVFGLFRARVGGGWQQSTFSTAGNDFRSSGRIAQFGVEHPRFHISGSIDNSIGNSLQTLGQSYGDIGVGSAILTPLSLVSSNLRAMNFSVRVNPMRKLELTALWTSSRQNLQGVVANDVEIADVHATYHFRRLDFVGGIFRSSQTYMSNLATNAKTKQGRFYIRVSRTARLL
jgi:hypothetical protein